MLPPSLRRLRALSAYCFANWYAATRSSCDISRMLRGRGGGEKAPGCAVANSGRRQMQEFLVSTTRCDVAWGSASSNSILGSEPVRRRRRVLGGGEDRCGGLGQGPPGMGHSPRGPAGRTRTFDALGPSYAAATAWRSTDRSLSPGRASLAQPRIKETSRSRRRASKYIKNEY